MPLRYFAGLLSLLLLGCAAPGKEAPITVLCPEGSRACEGAPADGVRVGTMEGAGLVVAPNAAPAAKVAPADSRAASDATAASPRRYVPVRPRSGERPLPVLAGEVPPGPGELGDSTPRSQDRYVPVQPLGVWDRESRPEAHHDESSGSVAAQREAASTPSGPAADTGGTSASSARGSYVLQLAAFRDGGGVDRFIAAHSLQSLNLSRAATKSGDGTWQVLTYGDFPSRSAAEAAAGELARQYGVEPWVRPAGVTDRHP